MIQNIGPSVREFTLAISISDLATVGAIVSPVLILLTYIWSQLESADDVESKLRDRLDKVKVYAGPFVMQITGIRAVEKSGIVYKLEKLFLFRTDGCVRVETFILEQQLPQDEVWRNPFFEIFCESREVEVDHIATTTEGIDSTGVIFRIHSLDKGKIEDFLKTVPNYLELLAERGHLESAALHSLDIDDIEEDEISARFTDIQTEEDEQDFEIEP